MQNRIIIIIVSVLVVGGIATAVLALKHGSSQKENTMDQSASGSNQPAQRPGAAQTTADGLKIEDTQVGTGTEATAGKKITVNYTGTLTNGTKFDSSLDRNQPFSFTLGTGQVIKGWDEGFAGMKVGGKRKLTIPPELGYGAQANGAIPANSTLLFDVELLDVQ